MNKYVIEETKRKKLGDFLKKTREEKKLGMNQLAVKIDVTTSLLHRLENGQTQKISPFLLKEVAKGLKIDYKKLYKIVGYLDEKEKDQKENSKLNLIEGEYIQVPIYDSVSAGIGKVPNPEPLDFLSLPLAIGRGCVGITVDGDSMETTINNGSVVLIKKDLEVGQNDIGVFLYEDEAIVKRYKCIENKCYLISDNKEYPAREIREEDDFKVCGKVVWILNKA